MESDETDRDGSGTRDGTRVVLVACCLLAIGLAGIIVPAVTGGVVDSPAESLVPGEAIDEQAAESLDGVGSGLGDVDPQDLSSGNGSTGSQFGALNPDDSTQVGGPTGANSTAFDSQSTSTHFTVESSRPAYWRTGAYEEYTGSGWAANGDTEPYDGSIESEGIQGPEVEYEVELNRSASALPTVWRPSSVSGVSNVGVTDQRALRATEPYGPGTTYSGVSHKPPQDPQVLRTSGQDYPRGVEERYTQLPADTPQRLEQFTDDLTADADDPYEQAVAIERWLEANKNYSLEASATSDHMADTFVFEMEAGYCEYFATAMTAMLRSQDIPARYTVGYSTGQQVGGNTYQVRGMNAHAWVEVYFEDVGWVKFDPTPGSARLQQEQQSLQQDQPDAEYDPTEQGSPGETFSPDSENTTDDESGDPDDGTNTDDGPGGETESGYLVSLNRTAVPGTAVTVTVTQGSEPQPGVTVRFNGDPVGVTDSDGTVVGRVPYTDELRITVTDSEPSSSLRPPDRLPGGVDGRFYSGAETGAAGTAVGERPIPAVDESGVAANLTVPVETNVSVAVSGEVGPGATVTVTATVDGVAVENGTVLVDGTAVNRTDENGRAAVTLPEEGGTVTIAVERGQVSGNTTVDVPTLEIEVAPTTPLALPSTEAVVNVTADGDPVAGAPVFVNGERVATTGVDGTAWVTLPAAESATVRATDGPASAQTTVPDLFLNLALLVGGLLAVVTAAFGVAYHYGYTPRDVLTGLWRVPGLVVQYSQWALVTLVTRWDDLVAMAVGRLSRTVAYLSDFLRGRVSLSELKLALLAWVAQKRGTDTGHPGQAAASETAVSEERLTVRRAWRRLLGYVSLRDPTTKTPGEIARHAVDRDDLPARPVRVLRDTFREVEYGARSAEERLERVQEAVASIERQFTENDESESGSER